MSSFTQGFSAAMNGTPHNGQTANGDQPTLADLQRMVEDMRVFMTRRFDEVSFEINATSQIMEMGESTIASHFAQIIGVLQGISMQGDGKTPHNIGVELNAVVKTTEDAANQILDSASAIADVTRREVDWADPQARNECLATINQHTDDILAACAFQDLTGQRIACTLENIRKAESDLTTTLKQMGIKLEAAPAAVTAAPVVENAQSQADIDALFG